MQEEVHKTHVSWHRFRQRSMQNPTEYLEGVWRLLCQSHSPLVIDCGSYHKMWFTHRRKQTHTCVLYGILQLPICIWSWDTNQLWIPGTVGWSFCGALRGQSPSKSPGKSTPTSAAAARRWNGEPLETHSQMQRWDSQIINEDKEPVLLTQFEL